MSENILTNETQWKPGVNPWLVTIAVMIGAFMSILDSTIANVALPHMAGSFSSSNDEAIWILTSYLIASGIILPSVAWFSKVFGRKAFFMFCILMFTVSSILCGFATSLSQMIIFRILQGLGGGALMPLSQAILLESFPREKRGISTAVFGIGILFAPIIGPLLGGWITDMVSWHWIFFINVPFGIAALVCTKLWVEDPPYAKKQGIQKIDYIGFGFLILWLAAQQIVLDKGQNCDWFNSAFICKMTLIALIGIIGFFVSQAKNRESIVDLHVFKDKNYALGTILLTIIMGILYASMAVMPLFLQQLLGYTAYLSGYAIMPRGIGCIIAIMIYGKVSNKIDDKILIVVGLALLGISCLMLGVLNLQFSIDNIAFPNFITGLGMGLSMLPLTTLSLNTLNNSQMTNATGLQSLLKETGGGIGTSIVATILSRYSQIHQASMVQHLNPLNMVFRTKIAAVSMALSHYMNISVAQIKANYLAYLQLIQQSSLWAFIDAFRIFGLISLAIIPLVLLLDKTEITSDKGHSAIIH